MQPDWYADFFQGLALELWRNAVPEEQTLAEADFLNGIFAASAGGALLDVPSGNGRLAVVLAGRGFRLTGVELAIPFLEEAEQAAAAAKLESAGHKIPWHEITWHRGDMRELPWKEAFDGVFCMGNSFGYFDAEGTEAFFAAVADALRPGGRFVMETEMVAESLLPDLQDRAWRRVGEMLLLVEHRYDAATSRLETDYTFVREGASETRRAYHWVYTVGEIGRMLARQGLDTVSLFESTEMEPYQLGSPRLLLVAEKQ